MVGPALGRPGGVRRRDALAFAWRGPGGGWRPRGPLIRTNIRALACAFV